MEILEFDPEEPLLSDQAEEEKQEIVVVSMKALAMEFVGAGFLAVVSSLATRPDSGLSRE